MSNERFFTIIIRSFSKPHIDKYSVIIIPLPLMEVHCLKLSRLMLVDFNEDGYIYLRRRPFVRLNYQQSLSGSLTSEFPS